MSAGQWLSLPMFRMYPLAVLIEISSLLAISPFGSRLAQYPTQLGTRQSPRVAPISFKFRDTEKLGKQAAAFRQARSSFLS